MSRVRDVLLLLCRSRPDSAGSADGGAGAQRLSAEAEGAPRADGLGVVQGSAIDGLLL